jgi:hypothetical protein
VDEVVQMVGHAHLQQKSESVPNAAKLGFQTWLNLVSKRGYSRPPGVAKSEIQTLLNLASNVAEPWLPDVVKPGFPTWLIKLVVQQKLPFRPPGRHRCGLNLYNAPFSKEQLRFYSESNA